MKTKKKDNWDDLKMAYYIRSSKYVGGRYLEFAWKHRGVAEYLREAFCRLGRTNIKICDAGCGNGIYLNYLKNNYPFAELYGFDFAEKIVEIARENTGLSTIRVGNLENAPYKNEEFDLVLCSQVIEHLLDDRRGLAELYRLLKPGGYLILSTDNKNNYISKILGWPFLFFSWPVRFLRRWRGDKRYFPHKDYTEEEFKRLINSEAFEIEQQSTFRFAWPFPFYRVRSFNLVAEKMMAWLRPLNIFNNYGDILIVLCRKK